MKKPSLETKIKQIHKKMNTHELIKGSILTKEDGLHISSNIPFESHERRKISAHIATIFRYISKKCKTDEARVQLTNGVNLYMKYIPQKKVILTSLTNNAASPELFKLMNHYSKEFQNILS
ncbi:MAG: hypothetical protein ACTSO9_04380 [Candidatus Helarchaeota archaeon]